MPTIRRSIPAHSRSCYSRGPEAPSSLMFGDTLALLRGRVCLGQGRWFQPHISRDNDRADHGPPRHASTSRSALPPTPPPFVVYLFSWPTGISFLLFSPSPQRTFKTFERQLT